MGPVLIARTSRHFFWWMIPILLLVTWLGVSGLDADSLWYDEWLAVWRAGDPLYGGPLSPAEIWDRSASVGNFQTPAYYLLLAGWGNLIGLSEFGGRALSLLLGLLAVAWTYRVGHDLVSSRAGWGAAIALGASAFYVDYLHEMRAYALYAMLTAMTLCAYWRIVYHSSTQASHDLLTKILLPAGLIGLLYTHYFAGLLVGVLGLYHLLLAPKNRRWWAVTGYFVLAGALFLPWIANAFRALTAADDAGGRKAGAMSTQLTLETLLFYFSNGSIALLAVIGGYIVAQFNGVFRAYRRELIFVGFLTVSFLVLALIANAWLLILTHVRYLLALWVLLALLVGFGVEAVGRQRLFPALLLVVWIGAGVVSSFDPDYIRGVHGNFAHLPFRELRTVIDSRAQPGDVVVLHVPDFNWLREPTFDRYMHGLPVKSSLLEEIPGLPGEEYMGQTRQFIDDSQRVWLAVDKTLSPTFRLPDFKRAMADNYRHCATIFDLTDMSLDLYARPVVGSMTLFGEAIGLSLVTPVPDVVTGDLKVLLGWSIGEDVPPDTYSVALHVLNADGALVAQADFGLPNERLACMPATIVLDGLAAGDYTIAALVYDWQTGERLPVDGGSGERVELGIVRVG